MTSSYLELVRTIYAAWERGDYGSGDWQHPEIEFTIADGPTPGTWVGPAGIAKGWGAFLGAWEGFRHRAEEFVELDQNRVLVNARFSGRGKASGLEIAATGTRAATLFEIHDGQVTKIVQYLDRENAPD